MPDLKSQLRAYYQSVIWLRDPGEVIAGRTGGVTVTQELETFPTRRWWSQPAVVATAVALLALLMFGGGLLVGLRLGGGDDVADQSTTTVTTTTVAALPGIEEFPVPVDQRTLWRGGVVAVSAGEVWAVDGVRQPGLIGHLEDGAWTLWRLVPSPSGQVSEVAVAPDGTVWVSGNFGVFSFDGAAWTRRFDDPVGSVGVDGDGTVWIGGPLRDNMLWLARWDGASWVRVDRTPEVLPARIGPQGTGGTGMTFLGDGEVWLVEPAFGWGGDLVMRYDGTTTEMVQIGDHVNPGPGMFVEIAAAANGDLLVGGYQDGLHRQVRVARFDGAEWTEWPADDWPFFAESMDAFDMAMAPDGVLWFAFEGGLASVEGSEWTTRIEGPGVSAVDVAPDGTVWYADDQGVHIFSTTLPAPVFGEETVPQGLPGYARTTFFEGGILSPNSAVRSMVVAIDGTVWAVPWWPQDGQSAIGHFDGENWTTYGEAEGLPSRPPLPGSIGGSGFSVDIAPDGTVWIGTSNGVASFDGETWTTWGASDGLPTGLIIEVVAAPDGTIWAGWPVGIARFDGTSWMVWQEGGDDWGGLFFTYSFAVSPDGTVWAFMGSRVGMEGLARWDTAGWTLVREWAYPDDAWLADYPNLAVGADGTVWLATSPTTRTEVSRLDGSTWTTFTVGTETVPGFITSLSVAPNGTVWLGTLDLWRGTIDEITGTGLSSFDGDTWTRYPIGDVNAFAAGLDGTLWVALEGDLARFSPTTR